MYSELIKGISTALYQEFGKEYHYYTESIKQGWKEPCFLILPIKQGEIRRIGQRYYSQNAYDIHYFPKKAGNLELQEVIERLYSCLEVISVENTKVRGSGSSVNCVEGVLHFTIEYNLFILKPKEKDIYMEEVEVYGKTRTNKGKSADRRN